MNSLFSGGPDFLIIGVQKGGTSALHYLLAQHPEIEPSYKRKELQFFTRHYRSGSKGLRSYRSNFNWSPFSRKLKYEASRRYIFNEHAAERISRWFPEIKLILCLREPAQRALSHWRMKTVDGTEQREFAEVVSDERSQYIQRGLYAEQIKRYLRYFDESSLLILDFDRLNSDVHATMSDVFSFLGVHDFEVVNAKINAGRKDDGLEKSEAFSNLEANFTTANCELKELLLSMKVRTDISWIKQQY